MSIDLLETFLNRAQQSPLEFLSLAPLLQFIDEGHELKLGQLLSVYPPFVTKESGNGVSIRAIPMLERIAFLASFAQQIGGSAQG